MRKRALVLAVIMFVGPFASFAPIGWLFFFEEGLALAAPRHGQTRELAFVRDVPGRTTRLSD
jgi:hypothetical protein